MVIYTEYVRPDVVKLYTFINGSRVYVVNRECENFIKFTIDSDRAGYFWKGYAEELMEEIKARGFKR